MKSGVELISDERARQVAKEGWTPEHDDEHGHGEMAQAAVAYTVHAIDPKDPENAEVWWPWDFSWWKPKGRVRNLVRAGALIAAEIDRLMRAEAKSVERPKPTLAELEEILQPGNPCSVGRCATTQTERYRVEGCTCPTYPGNEGLPCLTWCQSRAADACAYCDHNLDCHRRLSAMFKFPVSAPSTVLQPKGDS